MRPIEEFVYGGNQVIVPDQASLMRCYYPIIGSEGYALYQYFVAFFDNQKWNFFHTLKCCKTSMTRITLTTTTNGIPILCLTAIDNTRFIMLTFWTTHALHHQSLKFGTLFYHKNT